MTRKPSSTVVGVSLSPQEYFLWNSFRESKNVSWAEFVIAAVEQFRDLKFSQPLEEQYFIQSLQTKLKKTRMLSKKQSVTMRIPKSTVQKWDKFCKKRYISRAILIKQAVNAYFNTDIEQILKGEDQETLKLQNYLQNMIERMGLVKFRDLISIFDGIDVRVLSYLLNKLESQGRIGRKGQDTYVPADSTLNLVDSLLVASNLGRILERIRQNPEELENRPDHLSLLQVIFDYSDVIFLSLEKSGQQAGGDESEKTPEEFKHAQFNLKQAQNNFKQAFDNLIAELKK
jgi:hypothetical protein